MNEPTLEDPAQISKLTLQENYLPEDLKLFDVVNKAKRLSAHQIEDIATTNTPKTNQDSDEVSCTDQPKSCVKKFKFATE